MDLHYIPYDIAKKIRGLKFKTEEMELAIKDRKVFELQKLVEDYPRILREKCIDDFYKRGKEIELRKMSKVLIELCHYEHYLFLEEIYMVYVIRLRDRTLYAYTNFENLDLAYREIVVMLYNMQENVFKVTYTFRVEDIDTSVFSYDEIHDYGKGDIIILSDKRVDGEPESEEVEPPTRPEYKLPPKKGFVQQVIGYMNARYYNKSERTDRPYEVSNKRK